MPPAAEMVWRACGETRLNKITPPANWAASPTHAPSPVLDLAILLPGYCIPDANSVQQKPADWRGFRGERRLSGHGFRHSLISNRRSMSVVRTYNIEAGLPTLDEARRLVIEEIKRAKREGVRVLKVIHGYGSSGQGGALCVGLRKSFRLRKKEGVVRDFIAGEDFSIFSDRALALLESVPQLRGDPDLDATNEGVTFIWLK